MAARRGRSRRAASPATARKQRERAPLVVVLGMHRSGSSAITRGLQALGVSLGDKLMAPAAQNNERGFFEDLDVYRFNEALLRKIGSAWHKLAPLDPAELTGPALSEDRRNAGLLLSGKLTGEAFAFKDPRTAVLLPFWQCIFDDFGLDVRYLITVRNPLESAASLKARDDIPLTKGLLLWAKHTVEALSRTQGKTRVLVSYERLLSDPVAQLARMAAGLGLPSPAAGSEEIEVYCREFLASSLRHNVVGAGELRRSGLAPDFVTDLYELLMRMASDDAGALDAEVEATVQEASRHLEKLSSILILGDEVDDLWRSSQRALDSVRDQLAGLQRTLEEANAARERAERALTESRTELERKEAAAQIEIGRLTSSLASIEAQQQAQIEAAKAAAAAETEAAVRSLADAQVELERLQQRIASAEAAKTAATAETEITARSLADAQAELERLQQRIAAAEAAKSASAAEAEATVKSLAETQAELERLQQRIAAAEAARTAAIAETEATARLLAGAQTELERLQQRVAAAEGAAAASSAEGPVQTDMAAAAQAEMERLSLRVRDLEREEASRRPEDAAASGGAQDEIAALRTILGETDAARADLTRQLRALEDTHQGAMLSLAAELQDFAAALAEARSEIDRFKQQAAQFAEREAKLAAQASARDGEFAQQLSEARQAAAALQTQLRSIEEQNALLQARAAAAETNGERIGSELDAIKANHELEVNELRSCIGQSEQQYRDARRDLLLTRAALTAMRRSTSWRITWPLRATATLARNPAAAIKAALRGSARLAWRSLVPPNKRVETASRLFTAAPALFSWTSSYKAWRARESQSASLPAPSSDAEEPAPDPALEGYVPLLSAEPPTSVSARAIAFYLPQYHPIPENDAWWGEGFTEWTKVRAAQPRFQGHYQPHEPGELGYYDLLADEGVQARQAELAKLHGIGGFCFYFYWFGGKRLLEAPIRKFADSNIDMPFCLCWANENWTRRWDGKANEVLIAQNHSPADDLAFIKHVSQYLEDPRYIRIDGRPLLLVYRPSLLPSPSETAERWRRWCRDSGLGEIYLAYTQSFENAPPAQYGFDAAIEFPPNNMGLVSDSTLAPSPVGRLSVYDWRRLADRARGYVAPPYKLFRGVSTSWDNTARRPADGAVFVNASPSRFREWLARAVSDAQERFSNPEERLIFINAWNEWAEGAHLEPDRKFGYAWLEAARRALDPAASGRKVIVVTHDLHRHGAQYLALNMARTLHTRFGCEVASISGVAGALADEFEQLGPLKIIDRASQGEIDAALSELVGRGFRHAVVNSCASGWIAPHLARSGVKMLGLVHELPGIIRQLGLDASLGELDQHAEALVFPARQVLEADAKAIGVPAWRNAKIRPQGLYKIADSATPGGKAEARRRLARRLGLDEDARFVVAVGFADARKGVDLFIDWAGAAAKRWPWLHFVWVGAVAADCARPVERQLAALGARRGNVHLPGFSEDTDDVYLGADLYALSSREDPFPSTALEALAAETPVIMVKGTGGIEELAQHGCVRAIETPSPDAFVEAAASWLSDEAARAAAGHAGRQLIREKFGFASYVGALADELGLGVPNVSVVVPNYNYARHLEQRLASILEQTLSPREIVFLDDASSDDSIAVAERMLARAPVNWRIVRNERNSGDVFGQWRKGAELAQGELVWIAEADDWADPRFLETASRAFARSDVVMSMTQSQQADANGAILAGDYLEYVRDVSAEKWTKPFVGDGAEEVRAGLAVKNTIPNVSAVLFRRAPLAEALTRHAREIGAYRVAGDWCVYVNLLRQGALAFSPAALNVHRRHDHSVTISRFGLQELAEIARMQAYVMREFAPDAETAARARAYLERLVDQFGLRQRASAAEIEGAMRGVLAA